MVFEEVVRQPATHTLAAGRKKLGCLIPSRLGPVAENLLEDCLHGRSEVPRVTCVVDQYAAQWEVYRVAMRGVVA